MGDTWSSGTEVGRPSRGGHQRTEGGRAGISPDYAIRHYEAGLRIGELSLGASFDGLLPWGLIDNRPFLRCMHGYGLCAWRLGQFDEAGRIFDRILWLNPTDNQGVRFLVEEVRTSVGGSLGRDLTLAVSPGLSALKKGPFFIDGDSLLAILHGNNRFRDTLKNRATVPGASASARRRGSSSRSRWPAAVHDSGPGPSAP
jgi:hypothetical protein